jgi:predicted ribosome quality control (RQC) complex YloA/Tae2 family protein
VHTTQYPPENPKVPPSFPMLLRKHLKNATVTEVRQHNFDRILEIDIQKEHRFTLVVELFSQGNIILLDESNQIILPLKHRHAQGRKITSKEEYHYPPERGIHPLNVELGELKYLFKDLTVILSELWPGVVWVECTPKKYSCVLVWIKKSQPTKSVKMKLNQSTKA